MSTEPLPSDLEQIERKLSSAMQADPSPELRSRITSALRGELRRKRKADRWNFAMAMAATFLIWGNLSLSAVSVTDFHFRPEREHPPVEQIARDIRKLVPELSREEAYREAVLMSAGSNIIPLPTVSSSRAWWGSPANGID
jgi:hypothetical protein